MYNVRYDNSGMYTETNLILFLCCIITCFTICLVFKPELSYSTRKSYSCINKDQSVIFAKKHVAPNTNSLRFAFCNLGINES